jgi:uridine phosphorylase
MDFPLNYPILDFDPDPHAIIAPKMLYPDVDLPEHCVVCFFNDVIKKIVKEYSAKTPFSSEWENGSHLYYEIEYKGQRLGLIHPGVGAAIAGSILEEVIVFGSRKIIACGGSGVLTQRSPWGTFSSLSLPIGTKVCPTTTWNPQKRWP